MVKIRLKRMGMKKKPFYRVVVADERSPRDGRFIEEIGYYDPIGTKRSPHTSLRTSSFLNLHILVILLNDFYMNSLGLFFAL